MAPKKFLLNDISFYVSVESFFSWLLKSAIFSPHFSKKLFSFTLKHKYFLTGDFHLTAKNSCFFFLLLLFCKPFSFYSLFPSLKLKCRPPKISIRFNLEIILGFEKTFDPNREQINKILAFLLPLLVLLLSHDDEAFINGIF